MGEKQERVWVVMRSGPYPQTITEYTNVYIIDKPVKVFDDRKDAVEYIKDRSRRTSRYIYTAAGCKKG